MFPVKHIVLSYRRWPVTCAWTPVKCLLIWYSLKVSKSAPQLHCCFVGDASQLTCSTCKSFRAPPFMLLVLMYNFVYYNLRNCWLVGWFGDRGKKGVCVNKKVHCGPVHTCIPNMIVYDYHHSTKLYRKISPSLLPSVLLRVRSTSNNANGNKRVIFFPV